MLARRPLITVIAERLRVVADEVIIVADDTQRYRNFAGRCVPDGDPARDKVAGMNAGLQAAAQELALVVGRDSPALHPEVLAWLVQTAGGADVLVIKHDLGQERMNATCRIPQELSPSL